MICYKKITLSGVAVNTASGSLYVSSATSLGNYPEVFYGDFPVLHTTITNSSSAGWISGIGAVGRRSIGNATFTRATASNSATFHIDIIAIGKWK